MILTVIMLFAATAMSTVAASGAVVRCCEADLPLVDLSGETNRHAVVAAGTKAVYQGHPTTALSGDGRRVFCVWTLNHGGTCGPAAESLDGGKSWKRVDGRLPPVYAQTHMNCPTLQKLALPSGKERWLIFSRKGAWDRGSGSPGRLAVMASDDEGISWRETGVFDLPSAMPPTGFLQLNDGTCLLFGQERRNPNVQNDRPTDDQVIWMSVSKDCGETWGERRTVASADNKNLCEPFALRSPDGSEIALLIRENRHTSHSMMCFSRDEGKTWTKPIDTCWGLSGDRHEGIVLPDGRLVIAFRDQAPGSSTLGQYVAWVGTYDDLRSGRPGQYRIHLLKHYGGGKLGGWSADTGYSGVELLPDGEILCTTYVRYWPDARKNSVVSTHFRIEETDAVALPGKKGKEFVGNVSFPAWDMPPRDVVICGGGPAGCAAAIAARRSGLDVLIVEAQSRLGGTATSGGVSHWLGGRNDAGEWVVGGIFRELSLRAEKNGTAILPKHPDGKTYQPYAWLPWFIHGVVLDSDRMAMMLDEVMAEEGIEVLFETRVVGVEKSGERITHVITHSKDGFRRIPAKIVIDATGDADVANFAGCPVLVGRDGDHLTTPASLTFHLSHVDGKALWDKIERTREPKFRPLIEELKRKGEWPFPYDIFISVKGLAEDEVMINTMRLTEIDGTSAESRTRGYVRGRREAYQLLDILRKHFPGFENAQMKSIAPMLGVRETRRIDGAFKLTVEDLRRGAEFPDTIGYSMYGWDLPDPKKPSVQPMVDETGGGFINKAKKQLVTPIPYRVMVPRGCVNLLCPGRAISVERDVLGPLRVMAPCMAMGEACGVAARQIARGAANSEVDVSDLLAELRRRGCIVDKSALPVVRPRVDPATGDARKELSHVRGLISETARSENLHPRFAKAFEFMCRTDLAELPCGRYEIDGTNCWAMVQKVLLKPFADENQYEVHRAFIDIQAPISGSETIGVAKPDPKVFDGFNTAKDYVLFKAKGEPWTLKPGEFAIFFPENGAHAPGLSPDGPRTIRKLVIKVRK